MLLKYDSAIVLIPSIRLPILIYLIRILALKWLVTQPRPVSSSDSDSGDVVVYLMDDPTT